MRQMNTNNKSSNVAFTNYLMMFGAICLIAMGLTNLQYEKSVKAKEQLTKFESTVIDYKCKGLEKYGDKISLQMDGVSKEIFFTDVSIVCEDIVSLLNEHGFHVTAWVDTEGPDYRGYSLLIGKSTFASSEIGKTYKKLNIVSVLMLIIGGGMFIQALKRDQS